MRSDLYWRRAAYSDVVGLDLSGRMCLEQIRFEQIRFGQTSVNAVGIRSLGRAIEIFVIESTAAEPKVPKGNRFRRN